MVRTNTHVGLKITYLFLTFILAFVFLYFVRYSELLVCYNCVDRYGEGEVWGKRLSFTGIFTKFNVLICTRSHLLLSLSYLAV